MEHKFEIKRVLGDTPIDTHGAGPLRKVVWTLFLNGVAIGVHDHLYGWGVMKSAIAEEPVQLAMLRDKVATALGVEEERLVPRYEPNPIGDGDFSVGAVAPPQTNRAADIRKGMLVMFRQAHTPMLKPTPATVLDVYDHTVDLRLLGTDDQRLRATNVLRCDVRRATKTEINELYGKADSDDPA